jgi:hypothetical protein
MGRNQRIDPQQQRETGGVTHRIFLKSYVQTFSFWCILVVFEKLTFYVKFSEIKQNGNQRAEKDDVKTILRIY